MTTLRLLLSVSRPIGWAIPPLIFVIGLKYSKSYVTILPLIQVLLLTFPFSILLYGVNDIYDYNSDNLNPRKNKRSLDAGIIQLIKQFSSISALAIVISSLLTLNPSNIITAIFLIFFTYYYSAPPIRFKERPPLDSISNGILFFLVFSIGYSFGAPVTAIPLKIYFVALCVMGIHSLGTVMDYTVDKEAGDRTMSVVFGKRVAAIFSASAFLLTILFSDIGNRAINYYFIFCLIISVSISVMPSERFVYQCFKLIFVGFVITAVVFLMPYFGR